MSESPDFPEDDGCSLYVRRFVEAYMGDAHGIGAHAVQIIGNADAHSAASIACKLLKRPHVRKAIRDRIECDPLVAGRLERLRLLTRIARGEEKEKRVVKSGKRSVMKEYPVTIKDRMDACAALSKAAGEHLPDDQADDAAAKLAALMGSLTVQQLFAALNPPEKGQIQ